MNSKKNSFKFNKKSLDMNQERSTIVSTSNNFNSLNTLQSYRGITTPLNSNKNLVLKTNPKVLVNNTKPEFANQLINKNKFDEENFKTISNTDNLSKRHKRFISQATTVAESKMHSRMNSISNNLNINMNMNMNMNNKGDIKLHNLAYSHAISMVNSHKNSISNTLANESVSKAQINNSKNSETEKVKSMTKVKTVLNIKQKLIKKSNKSLFSMLSSDSLPRVQSTKRNTIVKNRSSLLQDIENLTTPHINKRKNLMKNFRRNAYNFTSDLLKYDRLQHKGVLNTSKKKSGNALDNDSDVNILKFEKVSNQMMADLEKLLQLKHETNAPTLKTNTAVNKYLIRDFLIGEVTDVVASSK